MTHRTDIRCAELCDACPGPPSCDLVCFRNERLVWDAILDLGGFEPGNPALVAPAMDLPPHVPTIYHGHPLDASEALDVVAIPLWQCLEQTPPTGSVRVKYESEAALRSAFSLAPSTRMVLVGIDRDWKIERYYADRVILRLGEALKSLGFDLAIPPNYSVWLNEPRIHHLYNRKRSLRVAEEWSAAGIAVAPYFVGVLDDDLDFWEPVYRRNLALRFVVKEFQTGLRHRPERALGALDRLARLQDRLGRALHLIAPGGMRQRDRIAERFEGWTIIDATPFMKAVKRQVFSVYPGGRGWRTLRDADQRKLFVAHLRARRARLFSDRFAHAPLGINLSAAAGDTNFLTPAGLVAAGPTPHKT